MNKDDGKTVHSEQVASSPDLRNIPCTEFEMWRFGAAIKCRACDRPMPIVVGSDLRVLDEEKALFHTYHTCKCGKLYILHIQFSSQA